MILNQGCNSRDHKKYGIRRQQRSLIFDREPKQDSISNDASS